MNRWKQSKMITAGRHGWILRAAILCLIILPVFGCVYTPPAGRVEGNSLSAGDKAADTALSMVGRPYRYKGESPAGFDCSGLVRYSYLAAGVDLPHGTGALRDRSRPVLTRDMRKGDLLFFNEAGKKYSHVGIYTGDNSFVHAPSSRKQVRVESLDDPYWKDHFLGARRL